MKLTEFFSDERTWIGATLLTTLVGTYFYLQSVVAHVEALRGDFKHAQEMEDREDAQWLAEEMRHLDRISAGQAELRRMILDACGD